MNEGYDYRERISVDGAGRTVLEHLVRHHRHSTEDSWRERIEAGRVLLDGQPASCRTLARPGQLLVWRRPPWEEPAAPLSYGLIHRDDHLLGVVKPAGLPTLPGGGYLQHTLLALVRRRHPGASPVHRLDRGTSGLVLFARRREAGRSLAGAWRNGLVRKTYRGLVVGHPALDAFEIDDPIGWESVVPGVPVPVAGRGGCPARTRIRVLERRAGATLVEVEILSGRSHQIRVHLAAAGHPLRGDPFYAADGRPPAHPAARIGDTGFLLHAHRIAFPHPSDGSRRELETGLPPSLREARGG